MTLCSCLSRQICNQAGAAAVVAGTRYLLTHEAHAHPAYKQRILGAERTAHVGRGEDVPARQKLAERAEQLGAVFGDAVEQTGGQP